MEEQEQHRRRGALVVMAVLAPIACLGLAWWQWERFSSSSGTFQNLGYAFQWPLFAVFCVYAYRRFVLLETQAADDSDPTTAPTVSPTSATVALDLPARPAAARSEQDGELGAYNAYLASLAADDADPSDLTTPSHDLPRARSPR